MLTLSKTAVVAQTSVPVSNQATFASAEGATATGEVTTESVIVGSTITYTLTYGNTGSAHATNATITDALPAGAALVTASDGGVYDQLTNSVSWLAGTVESGQSDLTRTLVLSFGDALRGDRP